MRITFVGINYAPEPTGIAPYTAGMASALQRRGHDVAVITGYPHYPWWRIAEGYDGRVLHEVVDAVPVTRLRHYVPTEQSLARRSLMELDFGRRSVTRSWQRPDVVVVVSPAMIAARLAVARARMRGIPAVAWVQDIYTLGLVQTGGDAAKARLVRRLEAGLLESATRVVAIHERFRRFLVDELAGTTPVDVIRNWSHIADTPQTDTARVRALHGWGPEDVIALHAGNMGAKQGLDHVVAASRAATARGSRVRFVLMGDGNQRERLAALDPNPRLQFLAPQPDELFAPTLAAADVLLVNELPGLTEMSVPSKLTSYYAAGRPVVAAVDARSTTAEQIHLAGAGVVVDPEDPGALVDQVELLAADRAAASAYAASARAFRQAHLSESAAVDSFEQTLRSARD